MRVAFFARPRGERDSPSRERRPSQPGSPALAPGIASRVRRPPLIPVLTGHAVLSRPMPACEVTLVRHQANLSLEPHRHREAVIGLLLRGVYDEWMDGRNVQPSRATMLVKPPETPHSNEIGRDGTYTILIQIPPACLPTDVGRVLDDACMFVDARVSRIAELMAVELCVGDSASPVGLEGLIAELLALAARPATRGTGFSRAQAWLRHTCDHLQAHLATPPSLHELARSAGVHRAHLARAFRAAFGCTIGQYIRANRVQRVAERLVDSHTPIAQLAAELGFTDQAHLTHTFRRAYGTTPRAYRSERQTLGRVAPVCRW